jgi:hypothetical protein
LIIFAPLKINNLQGTGNRKMPRFRIFRQARYVYGISKNSKIIVIQIIHAIIWEDLAVLIMARYVELNLTVREEKYLITVAWHLCLLLEIRAYPEKKT